MTSENKRHSEQYKKEAVKLLLSSGKTLAEVAEEVGVSVATLSNWKRLYAKGKKRSGADDIDLSAEMLKLKRDNERLKKENEILKKAAAFFAKGNL